MTAVPFPLARLLSARRAFAMALATVTLLCTAPAHAAKDVHKGNATYYNYGGFGNCSLPPPTDIYPAAINATDYEASRACGGVVQVKNPANGRTVKVRIDDSCPDCAAGDLDLSAEAFAQIADPLDGRVAIRWQYVANKQPSMQIYFSSSTNPYYAEIQVRDHRYRIDKLAYRSSGTGAAWRPLPRANYNFFIRNPGVLEPGPFDFRITDVNGQVVTVKKVTQQPGVAIDTGKQFPNYTAAVRGSAAR